MSTKSLKEFVGIGSIGKTKGLSGELTLFIDDPFRVVFESSEFIFYQDQGQKIPLFIEYWEESGEDYLVKFEEIDTPEKSASLAGLQLYQDKKQLSKNGVDTDNVLSEAIGGSGFDGYFISDKQLSVPCKIINIIDRPHQLLVVVLVSDEEKLVPLEEDLIESIDSKQKIIYTKMPEGIFSL